MKNLHRLFSGCIFMAAVFCFDLYGQVITTDTDIEDTISILDEKEITDGWKYIGGWEFPGAKGAMTWDTSTVYKGKTSLRLDADFSGGGAYVGLWKDLPEFKSKRLKEIRMWVKSMGIESIGIRLVDDTEQCHQTKNIKLEKTDQWQQLILSVDNLIGLEHWGGANDGKLHGPVKGFGLNIGTDSITGVKVGSLLLDEVICVVTDKPQGVPEVLSCRFSQNVCRPGFGAYMTYRWNAVPMGRDYSIFVHFRETTGKKFFQGDHLPPVSTAVWSGRVEYEKTLVIPTDAPEGEYNIVVGIWDSKHGGGRQQLKAGVGVEAVKDDAAAFIIGKFRVDKKAPVPKLAAPSLDVSKYKLTFDEDFKGPLSVSAWGPGTRWIAHTPYAGDFGDARFADPKEGFPFVVKNGILRIEAKKTDGKWHSGLLSSVDPKGNGFSQKYGYFEMRSKLPKGPGTWPAFWLLGVNKLKDKSIDQIEIDVLEQYGINPNALCTTVHLWYADKRHTGDGQPFLVEGMTDGFHTYGVDVQEDYITFYYDRSELRRVKTPDEAKVPLYILANLALGSGWPIDETPNPSHMYIDYIRAYSRID